MHSTIELFSELLLPKISSSAPSDSLRLTSNCNL